MTFDRTEVFFTDIHDVSPVYHIVPDWHNGAGRRGEHRCNNYKPPIQSPGTILPDEVVTPCGKTALVYLVRGSDPDVRPEFAGKKSIFVAMQEGEQGIMYFPYNLGAELPRGHADKIGRPCKRCFPAK